MRKISNINEMTQTARGWLAGGIVGFVPILGELHDEHLALIYAAREACEICVASIIVCTTTNDKRDMQRDLHILSRAGVDITFIPPLAEMYPAAFSTHVISSGPLAERFESTYAATTLRDFTTFMIKLCQLVRPDYIYFSQKDALLIAVLRQVIQDLNIDVSLRVLPTLRESDGLAVSSHNHKLSPTERQAANVLYQALLKGKALIEMGERRATMIEQAIISELRSQPLVLPEYVVICHPDTFITVDEIVPNTLLASVVQIGSTRLIDNILWINTGQWRM